MSPEVEQKRPKSIDAKAAIAAAEEERSARLVNAAMELMAKRDQERRERQAAYRDLVLRAAEGAGQLPESDVARLVELVESMEITVDDFDRDVSAVLRDREFDDRIAALVERQIENRRAIDEAEAERKEVSRQWQPVQAEFEARRQEYDRRVTAARRIVEQKTNELDRLFRQSSDISDKQTRERSSSPRVWGP